MAVGFVGKESDGKSIDVSLSYSVDNDQVAYVQGWLGVTGRSGDSGDGIALKIDPVEYTIELPSTLSCSKGNTIWVDVSAVVGHNIPSPAYYTASGSNRIRLCKLTSNKNAQNVAKCIFLGGLGLS